MERHLVTSKTTEDTNISKVTKDLFRCFEPTEAQAQQGIDIEAEIMKALSEKISIEIDKEILDRLRKLNQIPTFPE